MNYYPNYNQYYQPQMRMQQPIQPLQQPVIPQPMSQPISSIGLQGKLVESIDVVKAIDIPLDGSVSYFPLTDNSTIVSKQLMQDGTSKITIYKPIEEEKSIEKDTIKYITVEDLDEKLKEIDTGKDYKDDIKSLKKQIKDLTYDFEKLNEKINGDD